MNRINSIRNLALAGVLGAFGTMGCLGQTSDSTDSQESDLNRKSHFVGYQGNDDGKTAVVEHQLAIDHSSIHPSTAQQHEGPRPEPWMDLGDQNGPRPEPWHSDNGDEPSSTTPPTGTSSSGGTSGGNPNPVK